MTSGPALGSVVPLVGTTVGALVGGTVGSIGARKVMDKFIEDDAVAMIRFVKEEFIDAVIISMHNSSIAIKNRRDK